jgi:thiamine pyrophosphokinase
MLLAASGKNEERQGNPVRREILPAHIYTPYDSFDEELLLKVKKKTMQMQIFQPAQNRTNSHSN